MQLIIAEALNKCSLDEKAAYLCFKWNDSH